MSRTAVQGAPGNRPPSYAAAPLPRAPPRITSLVDR